MRFSPHTAPLRRKEKKRKEKNKMNKTLKHFFMKNAAKNYLGKRGSEKLFSLQPTQFW
jgi:hypothetical protein